MRVAVVGKGEEVFGAIARSLAGDGVDVGSFASLDALLVPGAAAGTRLLCIPGGMTVGAALLDALPQVDALVSPFIGTEGFDRAEVSARGILIANGHIAENVESMAEATVMLILAAAYDLPASLAALRAGWPTSPGTGGARMLKAMTVGIVGYGQIGQAVAARLVPFGCRLLVHARQLRAALPPGAEHVSIGTLVERSDAIVLLASLGPDSHHLIDAELIARMKPDAMLINTARGGLIDEAALVEAANRGRIGTLALDVFETEPLPGDSPLRAVPRAILTPHRVGHTRETICRIPEQAVESIRLLLSGSMPTTLVNPEAIPAWQARREEAQR